MVFPCHWLTLCHFLDHSLALSSSSPTGPFPAIPIVDPGITSMGSPNPPAEGAVESKAPLEQPRGLR